MPPQFNTAPQAESKFAQFLIEKGVVQNESQANIVMVIFSVVCIGIAIYLQI